MIDDLLSPLFMREKIEALIKSYESHVERINESIRYMAAKGFYETATKYQADINLYRLVIADLKRILE